MAPLSEPSPFSPQIIRGLSDKLYEKRKAAALDVERLIRDALLLTTPDQPPTRVSLILKTLIEDFAYSSLPNARNGGLIALAAAAIALGTTELCRHLDAIIPPILSCFTDQDSRVRYYACESMYNVAKVARGDILKYFNEVFDALSKLSSDAEPSVKNGAELLDRLMKDIVSERATFWAPDQQDGGPGLEKLVDAPRTPRSGALSPSNTSTPPPPPPAVPIPSIASTPFPPVPGTAPLRPGMLPTQFNLPRFIPLLAERIHTLAPYTRTFLVQWISVLDSVPDLELIAFLPSFLDGLFNYLSDPNTDVRVATLGVLGEFLKEIRDVLYEETQATSLRWISEFITLAREVILPFSPMLLNAILPSLAHSVGAIKQVASETNANLYKLILDLPTSTTGGAGGGVKLDAIDLHATVETLTLQFQDEREETRVAALEWLLMLHRKAPMEVLCSDDATFQALLRTLSDSSEEVVKRDLQLLAQVSQHSDDEYFTHFMVNLLSLFSTDRRLLETRGSLIVRQLCLSLNPERMYRTFAEIIEREEDLEFASTMVQNLNFILITAPELADLRRRLKNLDSAGGRGSGGVGGGFTSGIAGNSDINNQLLFTTLYRSWSHNAVAVFSLCLLAQAYEHAANLLTLFADLEITVPLLIQIDKLVQLLESPVFTYLRLQLLEPERYPYLFKCLYGILMLLPQSSAFATLRNRLNSVSSMVCLFSSGGGVGMGVSGGGGMSGPSMVMQQTQQQMPPQPQPPQPAPDVGTLRGSFAGLGLRRKPTGISPNSSPTASPDMSPPPPPPLSQQQQSTYNHHHHHQHYQQQQQQPPPPPQVRWTDLLQQFRAVQARHERSRRSGGRSAYPSLDRTSGSSSSKRRTTRAGGGGGGGGGGSSSTRGGATDDAGNTSLNNHSGTALPGAQSLGTTPPPPGPTPYPVAGSGSDDAGGEYHHLHHLQQRGGATTGARAIAVGGNGRVASAGGAGSSPGRSGSPGSASSSAAGMRKAGASTFAGQKR
ncbi:hypothetical protein HDU87_001186 [Geranomyces variabilis]|uniref:Vacuolar protein 14 C-terminal Fig4-binding domain-containing protein n=1 Tax=Geranomyces variabilis TaxID=109894 RepID=A0AAD5XIA8_9FUNG|nr:hypothetical protein HDU87_001186 [Geranomyces variabilis]